MKNIALLSFLLFNFLSIHGQELLLDIVPGPDRSLASPVDYAVLDDEVFFECFLSSTNVALWKTDGTSEGTIQIRSFGFSNLSFFTPLQNGVLFVEDGDLKRSNGQPGHSTLVYNADYDLSSIHTYNEGQAFFMIQDTRTRLFRTNGSNAGTTELGSFLFDVFGEAYSNYKNGVVVSENSTESDKFPPIISDGTANGTKTVSSYLHDLGINHHVETAVGADNVLLFEGDDGEYALVEDSLYEVTIHGSCLQSLVMDSVVVIRGSAGITAFNWVTKEHYDLGVGSAFSSPFVANGEKFYFFGGDDRLYEYDIKKFEYKRISNQTTGSFNLNPFIVHFEDDIFYWQKANPVSRLRRINLEEMTDTVFDTLPSDINYHATAVVVGNKLLYSKQTDNLGLEWWVYNGENSSLIYRERPEEIRVFPNPVSERLYLAHLPNTTNGEYAIFDLSGKRYTHKRSNTLINSGIDVSSLKDGNYTLQFRNQQGELRTARFVKITGD